MRGETNITSVQMGGYEPITLTKASGVSDLYYNAIKIGRLVIITGSWMGNITNRGTIATIPSKYRPSSVVNGGGLVYRTDDVNTILPADSRVKTTGEIIASITSGTVTKGDFTFVYTI